VSPEEISASYDSSIVVRRWLGTVIDFVVLVGILMIPYLALGEQLWGTTLPIWGLLIVLYYPLLEGLTGFTAGKAVARIKVVDEAGGLPGIKKAVIRTLARLIEVNPLLLGGIPAGIIVLVNKKRQRLGDIAAGTFVLKTSNLPRIVSAAEVFA
jgi:uncharacterized RDD family membrane protein YckC